MSLACCFALALVAVSQLAKIAKHPSPALREQLPELRRTAVAERATRLVSKAAAESWEGRLASSLLAADSEFERIDAASEAVGDLDVHFATKSRWGQTAVRLQSAIGLLLGALAFAQGERIWAGAALGISIMSAMFTHLWADSVAGTEKRQRELADDVVRLLLPDVAEPRGSRRESSW